MAFGKGNLGGGNRIKSVYHVSKTLSAGTATQTEAPGFTVDQNSAIIANVSFANNTSNLGTNSAVTVDLISNTQVTYTRAASTGDVIIEYDVIEYEGVKNIYPITGTFVASGNVAIGGTPDNTKSFVEYSFRSTTASAHFELTGKVLGTGFVAFAGITGTNYTVVGYVVELY